MVRIVLQEIANSIDFNSLPPEWSSFDLRKFSRNKVLYDYQEEALKNAMKVLWLYFEKFNENKKKLLNEYEAFGANPGVFSIKKSKKLFNVLTEYYELKNGEIPPENRINRMCFWMATGSGKTVLLVKLIETLTLLMRRRCIPEKDILILTHREDLIEQIKNHMDEFSQDNETKIRYWSLKEYDKVKRGGVLPGGSDTVDVFMYRADLFSDEEKENLVDFRNYENGGNWYVLLDEAHKGDKEESKRQFYYHVMSRKGFLFNYSATFTDPIDIYTTVYNFNLEQFITRGYGKNIYLSSESLGVFKDEFPSKEKQKVVLKSLVLQTYLKKVFREIRRHGDYYHKPLMVVFVNTVNPRDDDSFGEPDLLRFFEEVEKISSGREKEQTEKLLQIVKNELVSELDGGRYIFGDERLQINKELLGSITYEDVLEEVFNASGCGQIEVIVSPSNRKEVAFKMKTSDRPFALIKIGDVTKLLRKKFGSYEIVEKWENESYFKVIHEDDSDINIVMGSRAFYEGWDLNRPNVVLFINIGVGENARKFALQAIGRGVRIEPIKGERRRASYLRKPFNLDKRQISSIETLFVFGTRVEVLKEIMNTLKREKLESGETISLNRNPRSEERTLLVPVYRRLGTVKLDELPKFEVDEKSLKLLKEYLSWLEDDRILLMLHSDSFNDLATLQRFKDFLNNEAHFEFSGDLAVQPEFLIPRIVSHISIQPEKLSDFKKLEEEIAHFRKIKVYLDREEIRVFREKLGKVRFSEKDSFKDVEIYHIAEHYYLPLLSARNRVEWIKHIIKTENEYKFVSDLVAYLRKEDNLFRKFDWWMFSKIDEHLDDVYIPYYHKKTNTFRRFKPDFIFWLCKGDKYYIIFVDPKGVSHTDYEYKVDGYKKIFMENNKIREFKQDGFKIKVHLFLYTEDVQKLPEGYRRFWFDDIEQVLKVCLDD
ncbi:DEAD/DEAH box helicase family protein [Archaeoglobus sp.]